MANQQPDREQMQDLARQQAQFMAKIWSDPAFKQRLVDDPATVLREQGTPVPEGVEVRVVENTDQVFYMVLPPAPSEEISDEQLETVSGGNSAGSVGCLLTFGSICGTVGTTTTVSTAGSAGPPPR